mmetsp:Transcript_22109/g.50531  ORF Transcript_22109/g.50531 Transcript_22109/m.50531 type:complete len:238 (+) Transcript_22109:295-1008(+)
MSQAREHASDKWRLVAEGGLQPLAAPKELGKEIVCGQLSHVSTEARPHTPVHHRGSMLRAEPLEGLPQRHLGALGVALDHLEGADHGGIAQASDRARGSDTGEAVVPQALDGYAIEEKARRPGGRHCQQGRHNAAVRLGKQLPVHRVPHLQAHLDSVQGVADQHAGRASDGAVHYGHTEWVLRALQKGLGPIQLWHRERSGGRTPQLGRLNAAASPNTGWLQGSTRASGRTLRAHTA